MILTACQRLGLEIIDNRSCHPRGIDTTMVNKIYASDPDGLQGCESVVHCLSIMQHNLYTSLKQNNVSEFGLYLCSVHVVWDLFLYNSFANPHY